MRLVIRLLGLTVIDVEASTEDAGNEYEPDGSGTTASTFGFIAEAGDDVGLPQRWADE